MRNSFVIILLFLSFFASGATYYVDPSGSDSNSGSSSSPWKTLAYACTKVKTAGDIIHLNSGTFIETKQSVLAVGVSIEGEGVSSVIQSRVGGTSFTILLSSSAEATNGNQHISDLKMDGNKLAAYGAIRVAYRKNVEIYNCTFVDFNYFGVSFINGEPPDVYATGNKFHDNIVTNCSGYYNGARGNLEIQGQDGMLIYNNNMTVNRGTNDGDVIYGVEGFIKNVKIYNNTLTKVYVPGVSSWDFAIEIWNWLGGNEIYNNIITGSIDVVIASKGNSPYSVWIHDNIIGQPSLKSAQSVRGVLFEYQCADAIVERNIIQNVAQGVYLQQGDAVRRVENININNNIFKNIGANVNNTGWGVYWSIEERTDIANNISICNNVISAQTGSYSTMYGIGLPDVGTATNVTVRNNIIVNFDNSPIFGNGSGSTTIRTLSIENNLFYGNGNSNAVKYVNGMVPTANTTQNNIIANPLFVSSSDFHLQSGSPAIGKGIRTSGITTDYDGNAYNDPPSIGAYEYGSSAPPADIPVYQGSVIEDATPSLLDMTYSMALANIVPSASAFSVRVNSTARTVSKITVSGSKVQLTLASPVSSGDVVTVSYTKPSSNQLQSTSGGQAANISSQSVVNRISSVNPVFVSAAIESAAPSLLEISYDLTLANTVPAISAFSVRVNSRTRTVNKVAVSGSKVQLTLSSPVVYGDVVTVSYTKPSTNPLQTPTGGQAATISAKAVTNNVSSPLPVYASSAIENATPALLEVTYNLTLANIVPAASAFAVRVNSTARTVTKVAISGTKVQLTLASPVDYGDAVTVAYTKPSSNPLQTATEAEAATFTAQTVTNKIASPSPVYVSSAIANATPSLLEMTYDLSLANILPATSDFSVRVNSNSRTVSKVAISGTKVQLTLASPAAYGDAVTVAYTKPTRNPLQTATGGQAATLTAKAVTNNISAPSPVYTSSAIENATPSLLEVTYSITLANIVPSASAFVVRVNSTARTVTKVVISGTKVQLTLASPVVNGNAVTVAYTKPSANPLQSTAGAQAATISAQTVTNKVDAPSPVYASSAIENATPSLLEMTYDLSLANILPSASAFAVRVNSTARTVSKVAISGTKVQLTLSSPAAYGDAVTVAYTKPASNPLQTAIGGEAATISAQAVNNKIIAPSPVYASSVIENATPSLLEVTYSITLASTVPSASAFVVRVNSTARTVTKVAISGTKVQLTLDSPVVYSDAVTVAYTRPSSNPLQSTAGAQAATISAQTVTNRVSAPSPVYVSSAIEDATPALLEMTYSLSLANILPSVSAFAVRVNSTARTVTKVTITGTKVQLTLGSPVANGEVVTVAYTKPSSNPLQTAIGGQAATIGAQAVTNNVKVVPAYISSSIEKATPSLLEITYSLTLANIVPSTSAFTVQVNSTARTVTKVAISGTMVQLTLASPVISGDVVTVAYKKPSDNPLQTSLGGQAVTLTARNVINNIDPDNPVYASSVIQDATPALLQITYNLSLANVVPAATAFAVQVNSIARNVTVVAVSGTKVHLTLGSDVVSGDIVTVSYTKPASNPLQTATGGMAASISNMPVVNNCVNNEPEVAITSPADSDTLTAGANITITAEASDSDGSVTLVEFYNGDTKIGSKSEAPFTFDWNNVEEGNYTLTAVATDDDNANTTSTAISLSVIPEPIVENLPPEVSISSPTKGNEYDNPTNIDIQVAASDPDGTISKVVLYNGSVKLAELISAPYLYTWKEVKEGTYAIKAVAYDNLNATAVSTVVQFVVGEGSPYDGNSEIVNLYPNPTNGHFAIEILKPLEDEKCKIIITDLGGHQISNSPIVDQESLMHFDISYVKPGIYIMMVMGKGILVTKKFIKY